MFAGQVNGLAPLPVVAWASRTLSLWVTTTWAWWSSRSTAASVLGMISSDPDGCRFELTASARRCLQVAGGAVLALQVYEVPGPDRTRWPNGGCKRRSAT